VDELERPLARGRDLNLRVQRRLLLVVCALEWLDRVRRGANGQPNPLTFEARKVLELASGQTEIRRAPIGAEQRSVR